MKTTQKPSGDLVPPGRLGPGVSLVGFLLIWSLEAEGRERLEQVIEQPLRLLVGELHPFNLPRHNSPAARQGAQDDGPAFRAAHVLDGGKLGPEERVGPAE